MANISSIANAVRSGMCDALVAPIDAGAGAGKVKIYTAGKALLLVTITLNDPAFGAAVDGVSSISLVPSTPTGTAGNTGNAAVAVFTDSDNITAFEGTITVTGGGGAIEIASLVITSGQIVVITGGSITVPAS